MCWLKLSLAAPLLLLSCGPAFAQADLSVRMGDRGLAGIAWRGIALLAEPDSGVPTLVEQPRSSRSGTEGHRKLGSPVSNATNPGSRRIQQRFAWGSVAWDYDWTGNTLTIRATVRNDNRDALPLLTFRPVELTFPTVPQGSTPDPGQFGTARPHPLNEYPLAAAADQEPAVIRVDLGSGVLAFCGDRGVAEVRVEASSPLAYRLLARLAPIPAQSSARFAVSLRFGAPGSADFQLAPDRFRAFAARFPFRLKWRDHRPIGANFLASAGVHSASNPRGWFTLAKDVDVVTPAGIRAFRARVLRYAIDSIRVLRGMNAQGMVTWDPEGEEFSDQTYYGDPRLVSRLAPEMEFKGEDGVATVDEYFRRFRAAGLRVGVCVRPQQIRFVDGRPVQEQSVDAAATLASKIRYAQRRWGCTLFYIDSTVDSKGQPLAASIFEKLSRDFPDVLLMPENQTYREYVCTAPFDSFVHQGVTSTSPEVKAAYPRAFSAIYAPGDGPGGKIAEHLPALAAGVRQGDILVFHGWYDDPGNAEVARVYKMAGAQR